MINRRTLSLFVAFSAMHVLLGTPSAAFAGEPVVLSVEHNGAAARGFDMASLNNLPRQKIATSTPWHAGRPVFEGPSLQQVLNAAGHSNAKRLRLVADNDYTITLPVSDLKTFTPIVATTIDGRPMTIDEKGPLMVVYPIDSVSPLDRSMAANRSVWYLKAIQVD